MELDALLGLRYFKGLLSVNLHLADRSFSLFLVLSFPKIILDFRKAIFALTMQEKNLNSGRLIVLPPWGEFIYIHEELFNSNVDRYVAPSEYHTKLIDETLYPMRHQIAFRQYNSRKPHRYRLLWKWLSDARFPYTYKSVPYAAKPQAGDGPHYIKRTIDYVK